MLFYQSARKTINDFSARTVQRIIMLALACYPAGCIWLLTVSSEGFGLAEASGYALIFVSLISCGMLVSSSWQRIAGDESKNLDERELNLSHRANAFAFRSLAATVLIAIIYCALAADFGGWLPTHYNHFNSIFWGVFMLCTLLPTAYVVWTVGDEPEEDPESM